jgi:hypothetical protein
VSVVKSPDKPSKPLPDIETPDGIREVLERAEEGSTDVLPLLRKLFSPHHERGKSLIETYGDSYAHARNAMIKTAAGKSLAVREALRRKIDAVRDELAGVNPTPLERILCERVALCWFDVNEVDRRFIDQTDISFKTAEYWENRRDRAHKRFLAACKVLATVRRLGAPALQINLARQQVNVAGSAS